MKKILLFLSVLAVVFSCGKKEEAPKTDEKSTTAVTELKPEAGATLKVWESKGKEKDWMEYVAKEFEAKYGVKVTYENVEAPDTVKKLQEEGKTSAGAADLVVFPHDNMGAAASAGLLFSLNDIPGLTENIESNFFPGAVSGSKTPDGKFEELIEKTKPMTDKGSQKFGILFEPANFYFSYAFLSSNGGYVFKNGTEANDIGLNNEGAIKGLEAMLALKAISVDKAEDANGNVIKALFNEGKVAAVINGPWFLGDLKDTKVKYAVAPLPTIAGQVPKSFSGVRILGINSTSKYPQAAALFIQFATSKEMLSKRFEMTGQIPPLKSFEPTDDISKAFLAQIAVAEPMPSIPQMGAVWVPMGAALNDAWSGKVAAKESLDKAVKTIKDQMAATK